MRSIALTACFLWAFSAFEAEGGLLLYDNSHQSQFQSVLDPGAFLISNVSTYVNHGNTLTYTQPSGHFGINVSEPNSYTIYVLNNLISAFGSQDSLVITFNHPTTAIGADFGVVRGAVALVSEQVYVTAYTASGAHATALAGDTSLFVGFIATQGDTLQSVTVTKVLGNLGRAAAILPTIFVGNAFTAPEPSTWLGAAMGGLLGVCVLGTRRRPRLWQAAH